MYTVTKSIIKEIEVQTMLRIFVVGIILKEELFFDCTLVEIKHICKTLAFISSNNNMTLEVFLFMTDIKWVFTIENYGFICLHRPYVMHVLS